MRVVGTPALSKPKLSYPLATELPCPYVNAGKCPLPGKVTIRHQNDLPYATRKRSRGRKVSLVQFCAMYRLIFEKARELGMEPVWLKSYPPGVPAEIDIFRFASLKGMLEES